MSRLARWRVSRSSVPAAAPVATKKRGRKGTPPPLPRNRRSSRSCRTASAPALPSAAVYSSRSKRRYVLAAGELTFMSWTTATRRKVCRCGAIPANCTVPSAIAPTNSRTRACSPSTRPVGACETCRGFGRTIGIDYGLVIPDESKTLRGGAIKPWQTKSYAECQEDLEKFAKKRGIPLDTPWRELGAERRKWVIEGEGEWTKGVWYGVRRFFAWLETKSYKMHVRVLLSRYRAYTPCTTCDGARLKTEALLWRVGSRELAENGAGIEPPVPAPRSAVVG